jgi:FKBP-type peptidyl-prolyl cis-trans isomerase FkpA
VTRKKTTKSKGSSGLNRKNSESFIAKFSAHPDTQLCDSGLMYKVIDEVSGERVTDLDTVVINQRIMQTVIKQACLKCLH